jgi:hypothetical protein
MLFVKPIYTYYSHKNAKTPKHHEESDKKLRLKKKDLDDEE